MNNELPARRSFSEGGRIKNLFIGLVGYLLFSVKAFANNGDSIIGPIILPEWVAKHGSVEVASGFGLINFLNNILKLIIVVAGLFGLINMIFAGIDLIASGGDAEKVKHATSKITNALLGLVVIAASFVLAAIIGWLLFGSPTAIISPTITGVE